MRHTSRVLTLMGYYQIENSPSWKATPSKSKKMPLSLKTSVSYYDPDAMCMIFFTFFLETVTNYMELMHTLVYEYTGSHGLHVPVL